MLFMFSLSFFFLSQNDIWLFCCVNICLMSELHFCFSGIQIIKKEDWWYIQIAAYYPFWKARKGNAWVFVFFAPSGLGFISLSSRGISFVLLLIRLIFLKSLISQNFRFSYISLTYLILLEVLLIFSTSCSIFILKCCFLEFILNSDSCHQSR